MEIVKFIGTCSDSEIAKLALKPGRKSSWKNACRLVKNYSKEMYNDLTMQYWNPWDYETNIKNIKGKKYLHIVHSLIDYIFEIN